jgi:hypothetical protein
MNADQFANIPFETRLRRGLSFADVNVRGTLVHEDWQPFRSDATPTRHIDVLLKVRVRGNLVCTVPDLNTSVAEQS